MDVIMGCSFSERIRPWPSSWLGLGCSLLRTDSTMDVVVMVGPWMVSVQNGLDHERHHCWALNVLFS